MQMLKSLTKRSAVEIAILCLQFAVALSCIGYASQMFRQKLEINTASLIEWGTSPYLATLIPALFGLAFIGIAIAVVWKPKPVYLWSAFGLIVLLTAMKTVELGTYFGLTMPSRAARYMLPIALLMLMQWYNNQYVKQGRGVVESIPTGVMTVMRLSIALTFFGHGTKVMFHSSKFLGLIEKSSITFFGMPIFSEAAIYLMLDAIAIIDLVVVFLILATRWNWVPIYMGLWTLMTASSRVTANGIASWDDIVIRASYYGIPLAIFFMYQWLNMHEQEHGTVEEQTPTRMQIPAHEGVLSGAGAD
ncbi:MAG: hypothetical protein AAF639_06465 [Chloroflexota bacterium]